MDFVTRKKEPMRGIPLTPLIDVTFILIIFFMLTTSFMRIESMEVILPSAGSGAVKQQDVIRLYVFQDGSFRLGKRVLDGDELDETLALIFEKEDKTKMMLLTEDGVTMQQMVNAMDRIHAVGGHNIFVRKWNK